MEKHATSRTIHIIPLDRYVKCMAKKSMLRLKELVRRYDETTEVIPERPV